jgi:hypothetical protein
MSLDKPNPTQSDRFPLSLDTWAVLLALVLAAAVRWHIIKTVPW